MTTAMGYIIDISAGSLGTPVHLIAYHKGKHKINSKGCASPLCSFLS